MPAKHNKQLVDEGMDIGLQIAPMINVIIVIISVFVATASSGLPEAELGVKVPGEGTPTNPVNVQTPMNIGIEQNGTVRFNNTVIDSADVKELPGLTARLTDIISSLGSDQPVIIRPHAETPHERVIDVLNACSAAGVKNLSFGGG